MFMYTVERVGSGGSHATVDWGHGAAQTESDTQPQRLDRPVGLPGSNDETHGLDTIAYTLVVLCSRMSPTRL